MSGKKKTKKKVNISFLKSISKIILKFCVLFFIWGTIIAGVAILWFVQDLPDLNNLESKVRNPSITIQTQDGEIIGTFGDLFEDMVRIDELPDYVPKALMAVEDRRFYYHFGIDFIGLFRAAYQNYLAKRVVQGGSTLTQQLAKNFLISEGSFSVHDRSFKRKIQEVLLSIWLEWKFNKDQILTMYLNRVYFGSGTYGIDAASQKYFNKSARELSVLEAAIIAGLLKAPSRYSPMANPKKAIARAKVVLELMEEAGFIKDYQKYLQGKLEFLEQKKENQGSKYFCDWVYEILPNFVNVSDQDLVVVVTLDNEMQKHAQNVCSEFLEKMGKELKTTEYAFLAMTPEGSIKAMVGGKDYRKSQFNRVTQAARQAGSTFKMFIYLAAMENNFNVFDEIDDSPVVIGDWKPSNFRWVTRGKVSIKEAFARSVNSVSIRLAQMVTPQKVIKVARKLGITGDLEDNITIALGANEVTLLDLTNAFATYANDGRTVWPYGIAEIRDKSGNILYKHQPKVGRLVIDQETLTKMKILLRAVVAEGSGRAANIGSTVYGKTGSNGDRDAWFIGFREYNPNETGYKNIVTGFWTGNDDNAPMAKHSTGSRMPTRVTAAFLQGPKNMKTEKEIVISGSDKQTDSLNEIIDKM
jgi:penicillin-binding protein 1A